MRIPFPAKLQYNNLGTTRVEFGWLFDEDQIIFGVNQDGTSYIEATKLSGSGEPWKETQRWQEFDQPSGLTAYFIWADHNKLSYYNYFNEGKDLIFLFEDARFFLESFKK